MNPEARTTTPASDATEVMQLLLQHFSGVLNPEAVQWLATCLMGGTPSRHLLDHRILSLEAYMRLPVDIRSRLYSIPGAQATRIHHPETLCLLQLTLRRYAQDHATK